MPNNEQITLEIDERPAVQAAARANEAIVGHEKTVKSVMDNAGRQWQVYGENVVRVSDKSRGSIDRLVKSMEQQAAVYGKTGVERLIAQRDLLIQKYGGEERAVHSVTQAYDKMIAAERGAAASTSKVAASAVSEGKAATASIKAMEGGFLNSNKAAAAFMTRIAGMGPVLQAAFPVFGALAFIGVVETVISKAHALYTEMAEAPQKIKRAWADHNAVLIQTNDEMRVTNDRLDNEIAKLQHKPQNNLKLELDEARMAADHLADALTKDLDVMGKIFKENSVGVLAKFMGHAGVGDIQKEILGENGRGGFEARINDIARQGRTDIAGATTSEQRKAAERGLDERLAAAYRSEMQVANRWVADAQAPHIRGKGSLFAMDDHPEERQERLFTAQALQAEFQSKLDSIALRAHQRDANEAKPAAEAAHAAGTVTEQLRAELARAQEGELEGLNKINAAYREKLRHLAEEGHLTKTNFDLVTRTSDQEYVNLLSKESGKIFAGQVKHQNSLRFGGATSGIEEQSMMDAAKLSWSVMGVGYRRKDQDTQAAELIAERKIQMEVQKSDDDRRIQAMGRIYHMEEQMIKLRTGPGGERDAIEQSYNLRMDMAQKVYGLESRNIGDTLAGYKLEAEQDEARIARATQIAELQHKQFESVKRSAEGLWNTLLTKPGDFGKQFGDTIHAAVLKPITEGLAGMTAGLLKPLIYGADGQSGIAGAFRGMFGGGHQDPMKMSTDLNTAVTSQNSAAMATLTAVMAGAMGMAAPAMAMPAGIGGISLPSISAPAASGGGFSSAAGGAGSFGGFSSGTVAGGGGNPLSGILGIGRGGFGGILSGLKSAVGLGNIGTDSGGGRWAQVGNQSIALDGVGGYANAIGRSPAFGAAGSMLAMQGLMGSSRGTWGGVGMGAAGGAMVGFQMGGPLGALIGGGAGLLAGLGEKIAGVETPEREAIRLVKQIYSLNIDNATARQIAGIAKQSYGGHVSSAVRSPEVRQLLQLVAESTGQKSNLYLNDPHGVYLTQTGGRMNQTAFYNNGTPSTYTSNLPVMGPAGTTVPSGNPYGGGGNIILNVNGQSAADLLEGRAGSYIASNPRVISGSAANGWGSSASRFGAASALLAPDIAVL